MNDINFDSLNLKNKYKYSIFSVNSHNWSTRSFSASTKKNLTDKESFDFVELDQTPVGIASNKQSLKKFKKVFGGGYLGYKNVEHFGSIFFDPKDKISYTIANLDNKLIENLNNIPDTVVYSVLPFIRWHTSKGNYQTLNTSKSIKINRNTSRKLIADKLVIDLNNMLKLYELADTNLDFYVMSRPWLKRDAFDIDEAGLTHIFNEQTLQVPFIQYKDFLNKTVVCPRGKFKRLIFSEEAKYAIKFGYKINIEYCYQFERGIDLFKDYVKDHYDVKSSTNDPVQRSIAKLFLNALYGRMGMKELENTLKIVDKNEVEILDKNTNVSIISELTENKFMIKYTGKITDNIRKLYKNDSLILEKNKSVTYTKEQLRKSGINKSMSVPSAVHIAAAISSYARMIINEYKNIPGNPCIMSDTDSAVLPKPLSSHLVGGELGQMKLEQEIAEGIFIRKKLYAIKNSKGQEIIKSSGINSSRLNYNLFLNLLNGESIEIERVNFNVEWKQLTLKVVSSNIFIHGIHNIKTLYNTPDVNFKFISIYNPNLYSLIVHPLYPIFYNQVEPNIDYENKIKNNNLTKLSSLEKIVIFIFLFSFLSLLTLFLYKMY